MWGEGMIGYPNGAHGMPTPPSQVLPTTGQKMPPPLRCGDVAQISRHGERASNPHYTYVMSLLLTRDAEPSVLAAYLDAKHPALAPLLPEDTEAPLDLFGRVGRVLRFDPSREREN